MSTEEYHVRCECGHHCCKDCKCTEIPDPIRFNMVCPCTMCKTSPHECDPRAYTHKDFRNKKIKHYWDDYMPDGTMRPEHQKGM